MMRMRVIWEFSKRRGPSIKLEKKGFFCKDTRKKDPQFIETATWFRIKGA